MIIHDMDAFTQGDFQINQMRAKIVFIERRNNVSRISLDEKKREHESKQLNANRTNQRKTRNVKLKLKKSKTNRGNTNSNPLFETNEVVTELVTSQSNSIVEPYSNVSLRCFYIEIYQFL